RIRWLTGVPPRSDRSPLRQAGSAAYCSLRWKTCTRISLPRIAPIAIFQRDFYSKRLFWAVPRLRSRVHAVPRAPYDQIGCILRYVWKLRDVLWIAALWRDFMSSQLGVLVVWMLWFACSALGQPAPVKVSP